MLEKIDLSKKVDKKTYRRVMDEAEEKLGLLQRECKDAGIPVILVFEGMGAAGKGVQINRLIQALDPRGFDVYACDRPTEDEQMRPFLWRYWTRRLQRAGSLSLTVPGTAVSRWTVLTALPRRISLGMRTRISCPSRNSCVMTALSS